MNANIILDDYIEMEVKDPAFTPIPEQFIYRKVEPRRNPYPRVEVSLVQLHELFVDNPSLELLAYMEKRRKERETTMSIDKNTKTYCKLHVLVKDIPNIFRRRIKVSVGHGTANERAAYLVTEAYTNSIRGHSPTQDGIFYLIHNHFGLNGNIFQESNKTDAKQRGRKREGKFGA